MTTTTRPTIAEAITRVRALGIIPVVELEKVGDVDPLFDALAAGGLPIAEITLRTKAGVDAVHRLRTSRPDAFVGAGTVRSVLDAERAIEAGAQFIVSPSTYPELIELCVGSGVAVLPGVCTPTDVDVAIRAGASLVKLFPAEAIGGVAFLQALSGPFRDVLFVPTGGINASNLEAYLGQPQVAACGGSWMVAPALLRERAFDRVEELAREAVGIVAKVRTRG